MNIIETLPRTFTVNDITYTLEMHVTAWYKLCICYREMIRKTPTSIQEILCSVCVEPDSIPCAIEDTIGTFNEYIGNARNFDDAVAMLGDYVNKTYFSDKEDEEPM